MNLLLIAFALLGSALMAVLDTPAPTECDEPRPTMAQLA